MTIHETLRGQILAERFDDEPSAAVDDDDLIDHGHMDSLRLMGLVTFIGQRFGLQLGINELVPKHFRNINALAGDVQRGLGDGVAQA